MSEITSTALCKAISEAWAIGALPKKDNTKCLLIVRYHGKVSERLLKEYDELVKIGDKLFKEQLKELMFTKPWWGDLIPKEGLRGGYLPIPLKFDGEDE